MVDIVTTTLEHCA